MLNIISFFVFSILSARLFANKSYGKEAVIMASLCGYMGIMDLLNTYSTTLSNGMAIALLALALRGAVIISAVHTIKKCKVVANKNRRNVVKVDFGNSERSLSKAS